MNEIDITLFLQQFTGFAPVMYLLSFLGQEEFYIVLIPLVYFVFSRTLGIRMLMLLLISTGLNILLKLAFHMPRPYWVDPRVQAFAIESTYGMPSGHAEISAAIGFLLAFTLRKPRITILIGVLVFLVGVSRVFLGVHFASDVLVGWVLGVLTAWLFVSIAPSAERWLMRSRINLALGAGGVAALGLICIGLLVQASIAPSQDPQAWAQYNQEARRLNEVGTVAGLLIGSVIAYGMVKQPLFIDDKMLYRLVAMPTIKPLSPQMRWVQFAISVLGGFVLWMGLRAIFPRDPELLGLLFRVLRYALVALWMLWLTPRLIRRK